MSLKKKRFIVFPFGGSRNQRKSLSCCFRAQSTAAPSRRKKVQDEGFGHTNTDTIGRTHGHQLRSNTADSNGFHKCIEQHLSLHKGLTPEAAELGVSSSAALD